MPPPDIKISEFAVVLAGSFTPSVFQPMWFCKNGLLSDPEATNAVVSVIHPEVTSFHTEWLTLNVTREHFSAMCSRDESLLLLQDLVAGTFQLFAQSEVRAMGLNRNFHFQIESFEARNLIGDILAPKDPWKPLLLNPALASLQMQGARPAGEAGTVNVTVQPSMKLKEAGVFVGINDHFDLVKEKTPCNAADAIKLMKLVWDESLAQADKIAKSIVSL